MKGVARGEYALIIGYSHLMPDVSAIVTRLSINGLNRVLLAEPDIYRPRTFLYLDEYAFFGKIETLVPTLALARAKGVSASLLVQDEGLQREVYGPNLTQALSGLCSKFLFRLGDVDTADKASRSCGEVERIRVTRSNSHVTGGERPTTTYSMAEHFERVRSLPPDYFMSIPLINPPHVNACEYVGISPFLGTYIDEVPLHAMQRWLPRPRFSLPQFAPGTIDLPAPRVEAACEPSHAEVVEEDIDDVEWPELDSEDGNQPGEPEDELPDDGLPYR
jgi:hypothetical protein